MEEASCSIADSLSGVGIQTSRHAVSGIGTVERIGGLGRADPTDHANREARRGGRDLRRELLSAAGCAMRTARSSRPTPRRSSVRGETTLGCCRRRSTPRMRACIGSGRRRSAIPARSCGASVQRLSDDPKGINSCPRDARLAGPRDSVIMTKKTCGRERPIRTSDRMHLTDDGARIYGQQIAHDLTADLGILIAPRPC